MIISELTFNAIIARKGVGVWSEWLSYHFLSASVARGLWERQLLEHAVVLQGQAFLNDHIDLQAQDSSSLHFDLSCQLDPEFSVGTGLLLTVETGTSIYHDYCMAHLVQKSAQFRHRNVIPRLGGSLLQKDDQFGSRNIPAGKVSYSGPWLSLLQYLVAKSDLPLVTGAAQLPVEYYLVKNRDYFRQQPWDSAWPGEAGLLEINQAVDECGLGIYTVISIVTIAEQPVVMFSHLNHQPALP